MLDQEGELCQTYVSKFVLSQTLYYLVVVAIVVVNAILKVVLRYFSYFEHYPLVSDTIESMTAKMALASIINTGFITLFVNADFGLTDGHVLRGIFFNGKFTDFTLGWYGTVGGAIILTLLVNMVTPHIAPLLRWCCTDSLRRKRMRRKALTQRELNRAYEGSRFSIEYRYSRGRGRGRGTVQYSA